MMFDASILNNINTIDDYNKLNQEFQLKKQAAMQAAQAGQLDLQSKKNIYATQVLSAAASTGNQGAYEKGLQHLKQNGVDISNWAPDVQGGAAQAQAARLAQSPLGSLIGAGTKMDANATAADIAAGKVPNPNAIVNNLLNTGQLGAPIAQPAPTSPQPSQPAQQPNMTAPQPDQPQPATTSGFIAPSYDNSKTAAMNKQLYDAAYQQYKESPAAVSANEAAKASAGETGKALGDAQKTSNIMKSNLPSVLQRFQNMREASVQAGYGTGNNNEGTGFLQDFHKNFTNSPTADANATLQQYAAQGILPELGPQLAQAGVRGNKFLESIASSASGLDLAANPSSKQKIINGLESTYINNLKSTQRQLQAAGLPSMTDEQVDNTVAEIKKGGFKAAQNSTTSQDTFRTATESADPYQKARDAIKSGADPLLVQKRLVENKLDPRKL